ncbi:uncharacterized protein LOC106161364 [Lingula anatina]|uniref:Uncharacterized protein LOC106161364 n=1 Tax=Lingula anatina TaxID=7574 RepID=A0A1S3I652_LINAN|nr:uncharacterized protein LOC106161364 [Lingula anatina]|eukprot:XP_013393755.1 uncharacterized protein LOC106161364 [Lingula anatina]
MAGRHVLVLSVTILLTCLLSLRAQDDQDFSNDDCVIAEPRTEEGNYMRCDTEESIAAGTPRCCKKDNTVGCCEETQAFGRMAQIGTGIACGTVFLMTVTFIIFWCNEDTFPCLKKCKKRCTCCQKCKERREEQKRKKEEKIKRKQKQEEAKKEVFAFRQEVQDDFWGIA